MLPELLGADPLAVAEVIGDTHYGSVDTRRALADQGIELVAPAQPSSTPKGHFSKDAFVIDLDADTVTCPAGRVAAIPASTRRRIQVRFAASACRACPMRERRTKRSAGRTIDINAGEALLAVARQARWTPEFRERYRQRAQVERKNAQLKCRTNKLPWRGVLKARAWLKLRMAALNLDRLGQMPAMIA